MSSCIPYQMAKVESKYRLKMVVCIKGPQKVGIWIVRAEKGF